MQRRYRPLVPLSVRGSGDEQAICPAAGSVVLSLVSQENREARPAEDGRSLRDDPAPLLAGGLALPVGGCLAYAAVWPTWVRVFIAVLIVGWIVGAALYGYDASQWLWTGVSVFAAVVAMLVLTPRRRRPAAPDGPGGPRHREAAP
jgi:hypothetical protein